jgi:hypothetical protein
MSTVAMFKASWEAIKMIFEVMVNNLKYSWESFSADVKIGINEMVEAMNLLPGVDISKPFTDADIAIQTTKM